MLKLSATHADVGSAVCRCCVRGLMLVCIAVIVAWPVQAADNESPALGIHDIRLRDVKPDEFERFVKEKLAPVWKEPRDGMRIVVSKCDQGKRKGEYQLIFAFNSRDKRDKHFPAEEQDGSEAFSKAVEPVLEIMTQLDGYTGEQSTHTDYVLVGMESVEHNPPPRVYSLYKGELKEGVEATKFDQFIKEKFVPAWKQPVDGMRVMVAKGDRGERKGKYQVVIAFDKEETRKKYFPGEEGRGSEALEKALGPRAAVMQELHEFLGEKTSYESYVVLGE
jgi:hypothetical protein